MEKYGKCRRTEDMPKDSITRPAVIIKGTDPKKQIVPWDYQRALELWQKRESQTGERLSDVFANIADVTGAPKVLSAETSSSLKQRATRNSCITQGMTSEGNCIGIHYDLEG